MNRLAFYLDADRTARDPAYYTYRLVSDPANIYQSIDNGPATENAEFRSFASWHTFLSAAGSVEILGFPYPFQPPGAGAAPVIGLDWLGGGAARLRLWEPWNTIKTLNVNGFDGAALRVENWVDVTLGLDVHTPNGVLPVMRDLDIVVDGAKRGRIATGAGDDRVTLLVDSNGGSRDQNRFSVWTGAGDDIVVVSASTTDWTARSFDAGTPRAYNPAWTVTELRLGEGDDSATGGRGNDLADGGAGVDSWILRGVRAGYSITSIDGGGVVVRDLDPRDGSDGTDTLYAFDRLVFRDRTVTLDAPPLLEFRVLNTGLDGVVRSAFEPVLFRPGSDDILFVGPLALADPTREGGGLLLANRFAPGLRAVSTGEAAADEGVFFDRLSPDGQQALFASVANVFGDPPDAMNLFVVPVDGGARQLLTQRNGQAGNGESFAVGFSADGSRLVFYSDATNLAPGRDTADSWDLFAVDTDGSDLVRLSSVGGNAASIDFFLPPILSPDGSKVLFHSRSTALGGGSDTNGLADVFIVDTDGSDLRRLSSVTGNAANGPSEAIAFSPDGSKVLFRSSASNLGAAGGANGGIFVIDTDGTGLVHIGSTAAGAFSSAIGFSPDGTKVLFYSTAADIGGGIDTNGQIDVFVANLDGTGIVRLSTIDGRAVTEGAFPIAFTPDGTRVLMQSDSPEYANDPGGQRLTRGVVVNLDGSGAVILPPGQYGSPGATTLFSPDGQRILFYSELPLPGSGPDLPDSGDAFVVNLDGTGLLRLTSVLGQEPRAFSAPLGWSPDGTQVTVRSVGFGPLGGDSQDGSGPYDLYLITLPTATSQATADLL